MSLDSTNRNSAHERLFALATSFIFLFDLTQFSYKALGKNQLCWPHWEGCRSLPLLPGLPESYLHGILFSLLFSSILVSFWGIFQNRPRIYLSALWGLVAFKVFFNFVWRYSGLHNFEYFHLLPTLAFLLNSSARIYGAQVMWAMCYFLAAFVKLHESWIVGTYFSPLHLGMPLVPAFAIPFITQAVIAFEIVFSWGLLSEKLRRWSIALWSLFHVYSVILVGFHYPTRCILILWSLFLPSLVPSAQLDSSHGAESSIRRTGRISPALLILMALVCTFQTLPLFYDEDTKQTLRFEGYSYNMFDANYQCFQEIVVVHENGKREEIKRGTRLARGRCGPRLAFEKIRQICEDKKPRSVEWIMDQSINGEPFLRIVNEKNACELRYSLFGDNPWINTKNAPVVGYPRKNAIDYPSRSQSREKTIFEEASIEPTAVQSFIKRHYVFFYGFYLASWIGMLAYVAAVYVRSGKAEHQKRLEVAAGEKIDRSPR